MRVTRDTRVLYAENDPVLRSMMSPLLTGLQGLDIVASGGVLGALGRRDAAGGSFAVHPHRAGVRTVSVDSDGTFTWQRKTGKQITVYFSSGTIRSNSVTIPARSLRA